MAGGYTMTTQEEASKVTETEASAPGTSAVKLPMDLQGAFEAYAEMRARGPVAGVVFDAGNARPAGEPPPPEIRGFLEREHLFVARYDEVLNALLDNRFSSDIRTTMSPEQREKLPPVPEEIRPIAHSIVALDPPDHSRLRKLIQPSFSHRV